MKSIILAALSGLSFASFALPVAAQSIHHNYYIERTPTGDSLKCRRVRSQESLERNLDDVGWPDGVPIPRVNWGSEEAIIIAPDKIYPRSYLAFFGLNWTDGGYRVEYGWQSVPDSTTTCDPRGFCSTSQGLNEEPTYETLVVTLPPGTDLQCRNLGVDP